MGFYSTQGATKKSIVEEILRGSTNVIAHRVVGNVLWSISQASDGRYFIGCDVLASQRGFGWGYKPMDEGCGPCYYSCPLKFLDMQPIEHNEYSSAWRVKVRAFHANAAHQKALVKSLTVGATVTLKPHCHPRLLRVVSVKPLRGWAHGSTFRLTPRIIESVHTVEQPHSC